MASMFHNLKVGKADTTHTSPAHIDGVRQGNEPDQESEPGRAPDGTSTARMSTSINPEQRDPIDPSSPNLSPA